MSSPTTHALLIGQSLELWRAPAEGRDEWIAANARRQIEARAGAIDVNAGMGGNAAELAATAHAILDAHTGVAVLLDSGAPGVLAEAVRHLAPHERPRIIINAIPLGAAEEAALFETAAQGGIGAVLSPRTVDESGVASATEVASTLRSGARRAIDAGVTRTLLLDALAFPVTTDPTRWRRSLEVTATLAAEAWQPLVAVGNIGHGASAPLRPWLRLIYLALALGAGAGALILPVEETRLVEAARLIEGDRPAEGDLDAWVLDLSRGASTGSSALPPPPASAPRAAVEAFALCSG